MTVRVQEKRTIGLPRPPRTRRVKRACLAVNMHPRQLESLERRARAASMPLAEFVSALLFGDDAADGGADACPHGVAREAVGAGACVRCTETGRPTLEALDTHEHTHGTRPATRERWTYEDFARAARKAGEAARS